MPAPSEILDLVARFELQIDAYKSGKYNETQLRREFLDPFFKALGWDVDNTQGYAEAYKDVVHEDAIKIGGMSKAPDYSFRVGGARKFFLEAKKPSVNIKQDIAPAFQLRRYAWSAGLPLSILSDFEEFAVYDCRVKPVKTDLASKARILYLTFRDFAEKWDEIAAIFSKEAVLKGSFDRYAHAAKGKKGTTGVDAAFLTEIESWRELLAKNIAQRNPGIGGRDLNFAVQQTIDRIIFLRIAEDRGLEPYGRLQALANGANVHDRLKQLFHQADDRYNSGLFHFHAEKERPETPDQLTLGLALDDKPLKEIFRNLYYPDSPYEFSVLPADILGQVYEQFLGKVIRLTAGNRAVVEDKPEVKKAGGVFYTPGYIVAYIVASTVGKLLQGKTPKQAESLKILDPACGSGSFLIGAYQYLLDWHLSWYSANDPEKHAKGKNPKIYRIGLPSPSGRGVGGEGWRLATSERKRILLASIYGVDIDAQAVEVTKLSLLLKVLEGESDQTLTSQFKLFHERALPDLDSNIKCGNSLIGPDFYDGNLDLGEDARRRVNVFDWEAEFPEVFNPIPTLALPLKGRELSLLSAHGEGREPLPLPPQGEGWDGGGVKMRGGPSTALRTGFDAIIGNPPYVRQESLADFKPYLQAHYAAFDGAADLYAYFMEKSVSLLREGGLYGIIVSSSFLRAAYGAALRRVLKERAALLSLTDFGGLPVFASAKDTYVCIPLLARAPQPERVEIRRIHTLDFSNLEDYAAAQAYAVPQQRLNTEAWSLKSDAESAVFDKIVKAGKPLGDYLERQILYGVKTGLNEAFFIDAETRDRLIAQDPRSAELIKPLLGGEDIRRYICRDKQAWLIFTRRGVDISRYPAIQDHLSQWKEDLTPKKDKSVKRGRKPGKYAWYEIQDDVAYYEAFDAPKIIFPDICKAPRFTLDQSGVYLANTAYCLGSGDLYLLGILNSRLFWFAISHISIPFGVRAGEYRYRLIYQYMEQAPIRPIDASDPAGRARHGKMVALVESMLALHRQLAAANTAHDKTLIQRQIGASDKQIDRLVYELYGLTAEEIAIVENAG
ncbi:MAG: TaqI-like C-terminal specificity domain-containing protein [Sulfuricellaceae bacterium]|nr:TaqI-like C-terminal specificity domain-containing protein [Sulfuricellaceae bacterium]